MSGRQFSLHGIARGARAWTLAAACLLSGLLPCAGLRATAAQQVHASQAWIRVLPGALPAGAYVTLRNDGDQAVELTGAKSSSYAQVMLHQSSMSGGMSHMSGVESLAIPTHGQVVLAPAGYHLMLMHATAPVVPGTSLRLTLEFSDGSSLPVDFLARPANALGPDSP